MMPYGGVVHKLGARFRSPHNEAHNMMGSTLGPLTFGNSHIARAVFGLLWKWPILLPSW